MVTLTSNTTAVAHQTSIWGAISEGVEPRAEPRLSGAGVGNTPVRGCGCKGQEGGVPPVMAPSIPNHFCGVRNHSPVFSNAPNIAVAIANCATTLSTFKQAKYKKIISRPQPSHWSKSTLMDKICLFQYVATFRKNTCWSICLMSVHFSP